MIPGNPCDPVAPVNPSCPGPPGKPVPPAGPGKPVAPVAPMEPGPPGPPGPPAYKLILQYFELFTIIKIDYRSSTLRNQTLAFTFSRKTTMLLTSTGLKRWIVTTITRSLTAKRSLKFLSRNKLRIYKHFTFCLSNFFRINTYKNADKILHIQCKSFTIQTTL